MPQDDIHVFFIIRIQPKDPRQLFKECYLTFGIIARILLNYVAHSTIFDLVFQVFDDFLIAYPCML